MDVTDNADGSLDPRIQIELENLNDATDDINKLETELDEAHTAFRQLLSETTKRLKEILNKVGNSCVEKARCYYDALEVMRKAQIQCQQQAQLFQRASEIHAAAKETVALAESRFMSHQHEWNFDQAWQDMLNHATIKVMDAENQKAECGREHYRRAVLFHDAEKRLLELEEKYRRSIIKARPYFEVKAQCDQMLATQKERVECLQKTIQVAKTNYAASLRRLEEISNQIHQQRRDNDFIANGPREPGVGAELVSPQKTLNYDLEVNQLNDNRIKDTTNNQLNTCDKIEEYENACQLQEDNEHLGKRSVDGSEAISSQWELELQANMENMSNLSLESSVHDLDSKNLRFYNGESTKSSNFMPELSRNFLQTKEFSMHSLNQFQKLLKNLQTFKNPLTNLSLTTSVEGSNAGKDQTSDSLVLNKCKINFKNSVSKSLSNSPAKMNLGSLGLMSFGNVESTTKYVPNKDSKFGLNSNKSQSNSDINLPSNLELSSIGMETHKNDLRTEKNLYDVQLNTHNKTNSQLKEEIVPVKKWCKSNSSQFLSHSASLSPIKLKEVINNSHNYCTIKKVTEKTSNVKELPLLSLLEKKHFLTDGKGKSFSMINLNDKHNFMSLDDLRLSNAKTISTKTLENLKDNLCSEIP
ncbi:PREDICTED: SH3 domain-binding protein 5 homolog [Dufourea novaeangliae]|uniref:SH3 domain-binding protein 5 like protein n=1 Tax=Dufourea novaeangliae TaxID=178035 RepID=A0A154P8J3_DUFNO|nr:PREDICTED: SH3 domain-binding protein 5 homolog [Dufourea novaeangliae]KZC08177.1 SH3 domain-binding protein 5 like protein [Dufourea novaeangliae]